MESQQEKKQSDIEQILFNGLNEHGFVFQEKCVEELQKIAKDTRWMVRDTEYPVETETKNTRIDVVLEYHPPYVNNYTNRFYAVVECKRVNQKYSYWLFGKPLEVQNRDAHIIKIRGEIQEDLDNRRKYLINFLKPEVPLNVRSVLVDNWWLQISKISTRKPSSSPQPIEEAFSQVCTGVFGLSEEIYRKMQKDSRESSVFMIPIIITTAPLFYAGYDLDAVEVSSGILERKDVYFGEAKNKPDELHWIQVNYPVNHSMLPSDVNYTSSINSYSGLRTDYQNSIFIVNSKYIMEFFSRLSLWD